MSTPDFDAQRRRWEGRVSRLGPERAVYHNRRDPATFRQIEAEHQAAILPTLVASLTHEHYTILDFGCGWGRWTPVLADATGCGVLGVDLTAPLIDYARGHRAHERVRYDTILDDGTIPLSTCGADVIFAFTVLSAITQPAMLDFVLAEWARVLRPGGLVWLVDNTSKVNGKPVRSPDSISRTKEEYVQLFSGWVDLAPVLDLEGMGEIDTRFVGRRRG
jgi:SAM-dependent methyltransferase